jgi:hypothetical protein
MMKLSAWREIVCSICTEEARSLSDNRRHIDGMIYVARGVGSGNSIWPVVKADETIANIYDCS